MKYKKKVLVLGPEGTFSHEVALKYNKTPDILFKDTIDGVFDSIKNNEGDYGIVPVENSLEGGVGSTLDSLWKYNLMIKAEIIHPINHYLCGLGNKTDKLEVVRSHPQAIGQCKDVIKELGVKTINESSTAYAAKLVFENKNEEEACICSKFAAELYNLKFLKEDSVQDNENGEINETRFFVINKNDGNKTGNDKTSIAIYAHEDRPGLLYEILGIFKGRDINLTKIESRPSKKRLGDYIFYMDIDGHREQKVIKDALQKLNSKKELEIKLFGSYPKGR